MLETRYVDLYAYGRGVERQVAERDIVLTYVLKMMEEDGIIKDLAFKGGTCIRKIYLGKIGRFSEDLDFTLIGYDLGNFQSAFNNFINKPNKYGLDLSVRDERAKWGNSFACEIEYTHEWNESSFKFEVSLREDPILDLKSGMIKEEVYFKYIGFRPFSIPCMCLEEVLSEKIRAAYQRGTARDFYDLYQFANRPYDRDIVKQLVVLKFWNDESYYNPEKFIDKIEKAEIDFSEVQFLLKDQIHPTETEIKSRILSNYDYLTKLEDNLQIIRQDTQKHKLRKEAKQLIKKIRTEYNY